MYPARNLREAANVIEGAPSLRAQSAFMEEIARKVREAAALIQLSLPDVDPHDLQLILECHFRPWGSGKRFFIHSGPDGGYVF